MKTLRFLLVALILIFPAVPSSFATNFTWDVDTGTPQVDAGGGTWDTSTPNWLGAPSNIWTNGNTAIFAGTDGTNGQYIIDVALVSGSAGASTNEVLGFTSNGYKLIASTPNTLVVNKGSGISQIVVNVAAGKTAEIGSGLTVQKNNGPGELVANNGGTLLLSGTLQNLAGSVGAIGNSTLEVLPGGLAVGTAVGVYGGGTLKVSGGVVDAGAAGTISISRVSSGTGSVIMDSGLATAQTVRFGNLGAGNFNFNGILTLNGGTSRFQNFAITAMNSGFANVPTINFNGGRIELSGSNNTFLPAFPQGGNAYVLSGGAIIDTGTVNATIAQPLVTTGTISVDGGLAKYGSRTLNLTAANTYTGPTLINSGTLKLGAAGSINSSNAITVAAGAVFDVSSVAGYSIGSSQTLKGNGLVLGDATISGTLAPGESTGLLSFSSSLTLAGVTAMEIAGTNRGVFGGYDAVDAVGALTYGGALTIDIGVLLGGSSSFDLFDFSSQSGALTGVTLTGQYSGTLAGLGGGVWSGTVGGEHFTFTTADGVLLVVPEPSAFVMMLGGLGSMVLLRRRRI